MPLVARVRPSYLRTLRPTYSSVVHFGIVLRELAVQLCKDVPGTSVECEVEWSIAIDGSTCMVGELPGEPGQRFRITDPEATAGGSAFIGFAVFTHTESGVAVLAYDEKCSTTQPSRVAITAVPEVDTLARSLEGIRRLVTDDTACGAELAVALLGSQFPRYRLTESTIARNLTKVGEPGR